MVYKATQNVVFYCNSLRELREDPGTTAGKRIHLVMQETQVSSLGRGDPLEQGMATHSSVLAWRVPWTEEPGRLQSRGSRDSDTT